MEKNRNFFPKVSDELVGTIMDNDVFGIVSHVKPDADAIYSSLAMSEILALLGKKAYLYNDGPFLSKETLDKQYLFSQTVGKEKEEIEVVIVLDSSTKDRAGKVFEKLSGKETIVIDHHSSGVPFYKEELTYIVPKSPSTTLLVDSVREALGVELTEKTAEYLFIGFLTDSGFFHFLSSEQAGPSLEKVTKFVSTGISPYRIFDYIQDGRKLSDVKKIATLLSKTDSFYDGKLLVCYEPVENDTFERPSFMIYPNLLQVEGVKVVVLLKEKEDGIEFGFRAKESANVDVGEIASSIGGGGHALASGATVHGIGMEEAKTMLLKLFSNL